jgi:hypothetical protein
MNYQNDFQEKELKISFLFKVALKIKQFIFKYIQVKVNSTSIYERKIAEQGTLQN